MFRNCSYFAEFKQKQTLNWDKVPHKVANHDFFGHLSDNMKYFLLFLPSFPLWLREATQLPFPVDFLTSFLAFTHDAGSMISVRP